jgi:hypothetical protein
MTVSQSPTIRRTAHDPYGAAVRITVPSDATFPDNNNKDHNNGAHTTDQDDDWSVQVEQLLDDLQAFSWMPHSGNAAYVRTTIHPRETVPDRTSVTSSTTTKSHHPIRNTVSSASPPVVAPADHEDKPEESQARTWARRMRRAVQSWTRAQAALAHEAQEREETIRKLSRELNTWRRDVPLAWKHHWRIQEQLRDTVRKQQDRIDALQQELLAAQQQQGKENASGRATTDAVLSRSTSGPSLPATRDETGPTHVHEPSPSPLPREPTVAPTQPPQSLPPATQYISAPSISPTRTYDVVSVMTDERSEISRQSFPSTTPPANYPKPWTPGLGKTPASRVSLSPDTHPSQPSMPSTPFVQTTPSRTAHRRTVRDPSGTIVTHYQNGAQKEKYTDGTVLIRYPNGDLETRHRDSTAYLFSNLQTLQINQMDGSIVWEFPNGQTERHWPDGSKVVRFPDGQSREFHPNPSSRPETPVAHETLTVL